MHLSSRSRSSISKPGHIARGKSLDDSAMFQQPEFWIFGGGSAQGIISSSSPGFVFSNILVLKNLCILKGGSRAQQLYTKGIPRMRGGKNIRAHALVGLGKVLIAALQDGDFSEAHIASSTVGVGDEVQTVGRRPDQQTLSNHLLVRADLRITAVQKLK